MNLSVRYRAAILAGLLAVCVLPALARHGHSESTTVVKVDGSSTVFPITEAVAEDFQKETRGAVRVTVGISGTGGGFKKLSRRDGCAGRLTSNFSKRNGSLPGRWRSIL